VIRLAVIGLVVLTAALLQTALFPHLALAGFRPDLLLLVTAMFALRDGPITGTGVGFASGLLHDLLILEGSVGVFTAVVTGIGYAIGTLRVHIPSGSVIAPLVAAFAAGFVGTFGYAILARLLGDPRFVTDLVIETSLLVALYNTLLAPPTFALTRMLSVRFPPERAAPV
jgi:rod shape-determining protein MreD